VMRPSLRRSDFAGALGRVTTHVAIPFGPWGFAALASVAVNEVTGKVYVVDSMSKNLLVLDGVTNELTFRPLEFDPCYAVVDPASNKVYVSHCSDSRISIVSE
jgi:DNA-binding beta-propeller fold protein YncE